MNDLIDWFKEEDFVTYTFTRTLLDDVEDVLIVDYVDDVMEALTKDETIDGPIRRALSQRLGFRQALLNTAIKVIDRTDPFGIKSKWLTAIETLPGMKSGSNLSTSVPEAFSEKIAKRLASTVPPRPVVSTSWEEAFAHLEQLCNDGLLVTEVLNFHDSHSLMVRLGTTMSAAHH